MSEDNRKHPFVVASRIQLRFTTPRGVLAAEDLWALSLKVLDKMYQDINVTLKDSTDSILSNPDKAESAVTKEQKLRLEVIKMVVEIKEIENAEKLASNSKAERREFLSELKKKKELDQLENLNIEDIDKELAALDS